MRNKFILKVGRVKAILNIQSSKECCAHIFAALSQIPKGRWTETLLFVLRQRIVCLELQWIEFVSYYCYSGCVTNLFYLLLF